MLGSQLVLQEASVARKQNRAEGPVAWRSARTWGSNAALEEWWGPGRAGARLGVGRAGSPFENHFRADPTGLSGRWTGEQGRLQLWRARCGSLMEGQLLTVIYKVIPFISESLTVTRISSSLMHKTQLCKLQGLNSWWQRQQDPSWGKLFTQYTVFRMYF